MTESNNLLRCASFINTPKSSVGDILVPLFVKSFGPSRWSEKNIASSNTCQMMWARLIHVNFDFTTLRKGWFNTLYSFKSWSYRGHTSLNNAHNNVSNLANISFKSYHFLGGRLGYAFFCLQRLQLSSCALVFWCRHFPPYILFGLLCSPWYQHQWLNPTFCALVHCHRASWV